METQQKVQEIGALMQVVEGEVNRQYTLTEDIIKKGEDATADVQQAKKELVKAKERSGSFQFYVVCWFWLASFFLLFLHWLI